MKIIRAKDFTAKRAWDALPVTAMNGITIRLHWTNEPYKWHANDGEEVFVVLDGTVEMRYREGGEEKLIFLQTGDIILCLNRRRTRCASAGRSQNFSN